MTPGGRFGLLAVLIANPETSAEEFSSIKCPKPPDYNYAIVKLEIFSYDNLL
jgi:hypothetical protein